MSGVLALQPCFFKLVAFLPSLKLRLRSCRPSQGKSKARHGRIGPEVHAGAIFVAGLVIVLIGIFFRLLNSPLSVVAFVFHPFIDRKRRHPHPRHAEVVRAIVVPGFRMRVGPDCQSKLFCHRLDSWIKSGTLGARDFDLFRFSQRRDVVEIQIEGNLSRGNGRVFSKIFRSQQALLFRCD